MRGQRIRSICLMFVATLFLGTISLAEDVKQGKLKMTVTPKQAYTFVDGQAMGHGNLTIKLDVGSHHVLVANYGYKFAEQEVSIDTAKTSTMTVKLEPEGGPVPGPRGRIQLESGIGLELSKFHGGEDAAVLLNGKKPAYFVGHMDEFDHNIIWKQELVVPPGTHQVTVTRNGKVLWSGSVKVEANQRVIVDLSNGKEKIKAWPRGTDQLPASAERFKAGIASATVVVAPVTGSVSANPAKIDCNQTTVLSWNSKDAVEAEMSNMSPVPTSGEKTLSPRQTTTYQLTASGPGGAVTPSTTVEVNPVVQSSLTATPMEIPYRRIGDKVLQQGSTTLNWSATNSDTVTLDPGGTVDASGTKSIPLAPTQTGNGPVDENFNYTLKASNACGGSDTKTVAVHLKGSIEPIPTVLLHSVFFPTAYPTKEDPNLGLVQSQKEVLASLADGFKKYLEYDPDAKLTLGGNTDERGTNKYNDTLSEMRVQIVKDYLVSQGIAADKIDTSAYGKGKPLDKAAVGDLQSQNPNQPPEKRVRDKRTTWLAYNRRVDIVLIPTNAESERFYPNQATDSDILWQRPKPPKKAVEASN